MSVARGLGGTFWWPSWKIYTRGKQTGYSGERATLHALTCFEFLFLLHSPRSFRLMPCKYYVKTPWNTTFLLYNPSFMFTFNDQSNKSINYDYWLFVRQFPNEQSSHNWFLHLFVFKKASLNIIRNSLPFFFLNKNYMLMLLYWIQFCDWIGKKKNEKEKPTYIQFPKVWDGEINIHMKRQNLAKHKNGSTEFLFIVITEMKSNA